MSVTTKDIAKACGVSRGTVDRALNDKPGINPKTKERILKTAKELRYRPDLLARSLVVGKTMSLGVVIFDVRNPYFAELLNYIELEARKNGYFVNITLTEKDPEMEKQLISSLVDRRVDGIIVCPINQGKRYEDFLSSLQIPIVCVVNFISPNWHFVGINDRDAVKQGVEVLVSKNYERIVFVCPPVNKKQNENIYAQAERFEGFIEAMAQYKDIEYQVIVNKDYYSSIDEVLAKNDKKTVIFCTSDIYALDIMKYIKSTGKIIPDDVGLMGFDNIHILSHVTPALTTIQNSTTEIAKKAVECLTGIIDGKEMDKLLFVDHEIIMGETI